MRIFILLFCISMLQIEANQHTYISEKIIVSSSEDESDAKEDLLKLKVYFVENPVTRVLQEKEVLNIVIEKLENFHIVVIKPINSLSVRNDLLIVLSHIFPDIFYINSTVVLEQMPKNNLAKEAVAKGTLAPVGVYAKKKYFINEIGLQWIALWCLSLIGLILSIWNRRKMAILSDKQRDLEEDQRKIENDIKTLGVTDD